jgi:glycosyltransferase involved in cell wall biosynthesis
MSQLVFVVPGRLDQLTGGYLYDRHIVDGLRSRGYAVRVIELAEQPDLAIFAALPAGTPTIVDGLALPGLEAVVAAHQRRLPIIALVHHLLAEETGLSRTAAEQARRLEAAMLPRCRGVICPSRKTASAVERHGVSPERIAVIPPGTAKPAARRRAQRRRVRLLLCVASLVPRKGHAVLVSALARLRDHDWDLLCVGSLERDPATARAVRRMIAASHLKRRVTLAGEWPQALVASAYRAADVFVLPSFHEGYGMAYAEAMAHGLPIVATTAGAVPETVPRSAGLLVRPGDPISLASALQRVLATPALAARLAAGSRAAGLRLHEWREATKQWEQALWRFTGPERLP